MREDYCVKLTMRHGYGEVAKLEAPLPELNSDGASKLGRLLTAPFFEIAARELAPYQARMAEKHETTNSRLSLQIELGEAGSFGGKRLAGCDLSIDDLVPLTPGEVNVWRDRVAPLHAEIMERVLGIMETHGLLAVTAEEDAA